MEPLCKRDRTSDNFARATQRLMRRCDQISRRYDADVYILVRRKNRHYDYNSTDDPTFPTPLVEIVSVFEQLALHIADAFLRKRFTH